MQSRRMGEIIRTASGEDKDIIFMLYHDEYDGDHHFLKLRLALSLITQEIAVDINKLQR